MSRKYIFLLVILAGLSVLYFTEIGSVVALLGMLTIVGIPLVYLMSYSPVLLGVAVFAGIVNALFRLVWRRPAGRAVGWVVGWLGGALLAAVVLSSFSAAPNLMLDQIVAGLTADDVDGSVGLGENDTLILVGGGRECGDLCQRLLLNGQVAAVIAVNADEFAGGVSDAVSGMRFWMADGTDCPEPALAKSSGTLGLESGLLRASVSAAELMRLTIAAGRCLFAKEATAAEGDAALFYGQIKNGVTPYDAGFDLWADTVSAGRLSFFRREGGHLVEQFRQTATRTEKLPGILLPGYKGYYMSVRPGYQRIQQVTGGASRYEDLPALVPFLTERLDVDLDLHAESAVDTRREQIGAALAADGLIDATTDKIVDDFISSFAGRREVDEADKQLLLSVLEDRRVPANFYAYSAVRLIAKQDDAAAKAMAAALFGRLFDDESGTIDGEPQKQRARMGAVSVSISMLPDDAILPYRADLERLAHDRVLRTYTSRALTRLSAFGADAVPTLVYLIENSHAEKGEARFLLDHTGPYHAAWEGLCDMGTEGAAALPALHAYLEGRKIGYGLDHIVLTLLALGDDPEEIWGLISHNDIPNGRTFLDRQIAQTKKRIDCTW